MKIVLTMQQDSQHAATDPSFGRCSYFAVIDTDTNAIQFLPNKARESGSGVNAAGIVAKAEPDLVIVGNIGPKAFQVLNHAGIPVYHGLKNSIAETIHSYHIGELEKLSAATK